MSPKVHLLDSGIAHDLFHTFEVCVWIEREILVLCLEVPNQHLHLALLVNRFHPSFQPKPIRVSENNNRLRSLVLSELSQEFHHPVIVKRCRQKKERQKEEL